MLPEFVIFWHVPFRFEVLSNIKLITSRLSSQDPSQNDTFRDHFLDVPTDMSKVRFKCHIHHVEDLFKLLF